MAPSTRSESTISMGYPESDMSKDDIIADLRRQLHEASLSSAASSAGESVGRASSASRGRRRRRNRNRAADAGPAPGPDVRTANNAVSTALTTHFAAQRNYRQQHHDAHHHHYHAPPPAQTQTAPAHPTGAPASTAEKKKGVPRLQLGLNLNVELELKAHLEGDITIALLND